MHPILKNSKFKHQAQQLLSQASLGRSWPQMAVQCGAVKYSAISWLCAVAMQWQCSDVASKVQWWQRQGQLLPFNPKNAHEWGGIYRDGYLKQMLSGKKTHS
jgi:hypothetical protein